MGLIEGARSFLAVAETGAFSAAGRQLGHSPQQISKQIAALEARLGHSLFYRTTRAVSLTDEGRRWLPHAREIIAAVEAGDTALRGAQAALSGVLRLTCGTTLGELVVARAVERFLEQHPEMSVEMRMSDAQSDLAAEGVDVAVRIGLTRDSSLRVRRVGQTRLKVAASPAYLAAEGAPTHPQDLGTHRALLDLNSQPPERWRFDGPDGPLTVTVRGRFAVNSAALTLRAAREGRGLVRAPCIFLAPDLASGALVEVLPEFGQEVLPVSLLTPAARFRPAKVDAFAAVLQQHLSQAAA